MIFVLDTNVLSERTKKNPDSSVASFLRSLPMENIRLSAVVLAEIAQGVENNPTEPLKKFLAEMLSLPIADFGEAEALAWARMTTAALKKGASLKMRDTLIAATAGARGWTVATRNVKDFEPLGVLTFNPWEEKLSK